MVNQDVRKYWEMAEACHPGPMRAYARDLAEYLRDVLKLIGTDEYVCQTCGVHRDATSPSLTSFWVAIDGTAFCPTHHAEFQVYVEKNRPRPLKTAPSRGMA